MNNSREDKIWEQYIKAEQLNEEASKILSRFNISFIMSIIFTALFFTLFAFFSYLKNAPAVTIIFLLWVVVSLTLSFGYGGRYMFVGFASVAGKMMKFKIIGSILSVIYFAFWFFITFMLPFANILSVRMYLKKETVSLGHTLDMIKEHPDFKKIFEKKNNPDT